MRGSVVKTMKLTKKHVRWAPIFAAFAVATGALVSSFTASASGMTFTQIATQPQAAVGLTGYNGKTWSADITAIDFDGNSLIAGYGDWMFNSDSAGGPDAKTGIRPLDLATRQWGTLFPTKSESIQHIRHINGHLYVPTVDPSSGTGGYATNASGAWVNVFPDELKPAVHVFDIVSPTNSDQDLWLFGMTNNPPIGGPDDAALATVWHSADGGATWATVKQEGSTPVTASGGFERYYSAAVLNGKIYTQASSTYPATPMQVYDSATGQWGTLPRVNGCFSSVSMSLVETFDGHIICSGQQGSLTLFDGVSASTTKIEDGYSTPISAYKDGGYLYVLLNSGAIYRTHSFAAGWEYLGTVDSTATAIGAHNNRIYVGDADARIWESSDISTAVDVSPKILSLDTDRIYLDGTTTNITVSGSDFASTATATVEGASVPIITRTSSSVQLSLDTSHLPKPDTSKAPTVVTAQYKTYIKHYTVAISNENGGSAGEASVMAIYRVLNTDASAGAGISIPSDNNNPSSSGSGGTSTGVTSSANHSAPRQGGSLANTGDSQLRLIVLATSCIAVSLGLIFISILKKRRHSTR